MTLENNTPAPRDPDSVDRASISPHAMYVWDDEAPNPDLAMVPVTRRMLEGRASGAAGSAAVSLSRISLTLTGEAQPLPNIPAEATGARIAVEGGNARIATAAPLPTPANGEPLLDGAAGHVTGRSDLLAFRAVTASGAPVLWITYTGAAS